MWKKTPASKPGGEMFLRNDAEKQKGILELHGGAVIFNAESLIDA